MSKANEIKTLVDLFIWAIKVVFEKAKQEQSRNGMLSFLNRHSGEQQLAKIENITVCDQHSALMASYLNPALIDYYTRMEKKWGRDISTLHSQQVQRGKHNTRVIQQNNHEFNVLLTKLNNQLGFNIIPDAQGKTLYHMAAERGQIGLVILLYTVFKISSVLQMDAHNIQEFFAAVKANTNFQRLEQHDPELLASVMNFIANVLQYSNKDDSVASTNTGGQSKAVIQQSA